MKKIFFTILFAFTALFSIGQIAGGFYYGTDYGGNVYVYFQGTNISQYNLQFKIRSVNEQLDEEKSWNCKLSMGENFTVGPSDGWYWQLGEKLIITYPNGASYHWVYAPQQNYNNNYNYNNSPNPNQTNDYYKKSQIESIKFQISQLDQKIRDSERSLALYKELGEKNYSISNTMLQQSTLRLIQTYRTQKSSLESQLRSLQY